MTIRGPSPQSSPRSWDKSPLANGASYFWNGRIDETSPPGVSQETGFGVSFPNYVIDIQTDKKGDYTELIQFQCIEVGGVRLYEGIDFMSKTPEMNDVQLDAMHARSQKAGLYPYGASPEQMHRIQHRPINDPQVDNTWQEFWRSLGVETLLKELSQMID